MDSLYALSAKALDGEEIPLERYRNQVLLIVNTASQCGFTPQYEGLQRLHAQYASRGLVVMGFPCDQFGHQEPGNAIEIGEFCLKNYGVQFQMFDKVDVNGDHAHPLFQYLKHQEPGVLGTEAIKWNFTKFLVDRSGRVVHRYASLTKPESLVTDIEALLG